jgi:hypothetical protein
MTDQSPEYRFEYEDKTGKLSTNRPGVVQWAVSIMLVLKGLGWLLMMAGITYTLYARGGDLAGILSHLFGK